MMKQIAHLFEIAQILARATATDEQQLNAPNTPDAPKIPPPPQDEKHPPPHKT